MSKITLAFKMMVLEAVDYFPPKLRGYGLAQLEDNTVIKWIEEYKKLYPKQQVWKSFGSGIDRQCLDALTEVSSTTRGYILDEMNWNNDFNRQYPGYSNAYIRVAGTDRKVLKEIKDMSAPVRSYLVRRMNWIKYFDFNYPGYINNRSITVDIDQKLKNLIQTVVNPTVRNYLLQNV